LLSLLPTLKPEEPAVLDLFPDRRYRAGDLPLLARHRSARRGWPTEQATSLVDKPLRFQDEWCPDGLFPGGHPWTGSSRLLSAIPEHI